ncbi:MAG: hypothetical protein J7K68_03365 [Candidatus Diapherotrites archaeon]|nr:hypothetical protein [Candidatus Diapherotrites archaeon]
MKMNELSKLCIIIAFSLLLISVINWVRLESSPYTAFKGGIPSLDAYKVGEYLQRLREVELVEPSDVGTLAALEVNHWTYILSISLTGFALSVNFLVFAIVSFLFPPKRAIRARTKTIFYGIVALFLLLTIGAPKPLFSLFGLLGINGVINFELIPIFFVLLSIILFLAFADVWLPKKFWVFR